MLSLELQAVMQEQEKRIALDSGNVCMSYLHDKGS